MLELGASVFLEQLLLVIISTHFISFFMSQCAMIQNGGCGYLKAAESRWIRDVIGSEIGKPTPEIHVKMRRKCENSNQWTDSCR